MKLEELQQQVAACTACPLHQNRTHSVFSSGPPNSPLMIIGEGPGEQEDLTGFPFVGRAGELLDKGLGEAELSRDEVYVTNVVKCRPPGNRNPSRDEMLHCQDYLEDQIRIVKPKVIVLLGKVAAEFLLGREVKITRENGQVDAKHKGTPTMTVLHPAYVLRNQKPEVRQAFFEAIAKARDLAFGSSATPVA